MSTSQPLHEVSPKSPKPPPERKQRRRFTFCLGLFLALPLFGSAGCGGAAEHEIVITRLAIGTEQAIGSQMKKSLGVDLQVPNEEAHSYIGSYSRQSQRGEGDAELILSDVSAARDPGYRALVINLKPAQGQLGIQSTQGGVDLGMDTAGNWLFQGRLYPDPDGLVGALESHPRLSSIPVGELAAAQAAIEKLDESTVANRSPSIARLYDVIYRWGCRCIIGRGYYWPRPSCRRPQWGIWK